MRILFIGHNGYGYPHTRVRCYHFAKILSQYAGMETAVLSFRDDLAPHKTEAAMYENLRDREKLLLTWKAIGRLLHERNTILYIQKAHFHSAAPYFLHRLGLARHYVLDYDDYDIPLSNFFFRGYLNRFFFGSNRWDEITFRLARNANGCVAASHELLNLLTPINPNCELVVTGVDATAFTPPVRRKNDGPLTFLWNGLVWGDPILNNLLELFRAFDRVHGKMPPYRIWIVGGGMMWETLQRQAGETYPNLPIEWRGWVDPREMPDFLRRADVGLLPVAGNDLWLRCKSPTKLFEYMAAELAVIATSVGEVIHAVEPGRSGLLAANETEFADCILRVASDPPLRERLGLEARTRIETRFSLPILGETLHSFLAKTFPHT